MARPKLGTIIPLQNPNVMLVPDIHDLFQRAFTNTKEAPPWREEVRAEVCRSIGQPAFQCWVAEERNQFKGLLIVTLPTSWLSPHPWVYLAYNEGTRALNKQMANVAVEFLKERGYDHALATNTTMEEPTYKRLFAPFGRQRDLGTLKEFSIK